MRQCSHHSLSTTNAENELRCAAKSLFRKILPLSHYESRFYSDLRRSTQCKLLRIKILPNTKKKIRGVLYDLRLGRDPLVEAISANLASSALDTICTGPRRELPSDHAR